MQNRSEQINELAGALALAQGEFKPVKKTGSNPHLKNSYVTLDGIIEMIRTPLSNHGLSYVQLLSTQQQSREEGHVEDVPALTTTLMHSSGQWMSATVIISVLGGNRGVNELQAFGSSLTYMKRYALAAMLGVSSDEDNDGNGATVAPQRQRTAAKTPPRKSVESLAFSSPQAAIAWGFDQGAFTHKKHAENSYNKLKDEKQPSSAQEMGKLWREKVANKLIAKETAGAQVNNALHPDDPGAGL